MSRWGLSGMRSFEQVDVARKEGARLLENRNIPEPETTSERLSAQQAL